MLDELNSKGYYTFEYEYSYFNQSGGRLSNTEDGIICAPTPLEAYQKIVDRVEEKKIDLKSKKLRFIKFKVTSFNLVERLAITKDV